MIPNVYEVAPNLTVRVCQTEKLKAGMISLSVVLPIQRDQTHLTSLLLSVLHRGTQKYPSIAALNRRLDYLFGTEISVRNYYRGDKHVIGIAADLLGEEYLPVDSGINLMEEVLGVMREILFCPLLDENGSFVSHYVESEKKLQCDAIRALRNSPRAYAIEHCSEFLYENEPCGIPIYGTEEQISSVTPEGLTAHWKRLLENLKLDFFYVGPDCADAVCNRVKQIFSTKTAETIPMCIPIENPVRSASKTRSREEELPVSQGQLVIGLRTGITVTDADYYACAVMNEMLGVSPVSKLFVNVREKHGLCYHCSSHYNMYKGVILITCGLLPQNRSFAEREIFDQLQAIKDGRFDDDELLAAKMSLENAYRQIEDSPTALESFYLGRALYAADGSLADCRCGFANVTREAVILAAKKTTVDTIYFLNGTAPADGEETEDGTD